MSDDSRYVTGTGTPLPTKAIWLEVPGDVKRLVRINREVARLEITSPTGAEYVCADSGETENGAPVWRPLPAQ